MDLEVKPDHPARGQGLDLVGATPLGVLVILQPIQSEDDVEAVWLREVKSEICGPCIGVVREEILGGDAPVYGARRPVLRIRSRDTGGRGIHRGLLEAILYAGVASEPGYAFAKLPVG